jgi:uncharacterized protein YcnI
MKRHWSFSVLSGLVAALSLGVSVASAHVTVWPQESAPGAFERYSIRVPSERPAATTRVELEIPEQVTFSKVMPKPGWKYETARNAAGRVTGVVWSGGAIGPEEFDEFVFQARNGADAGSVAWKARQLYADGTTVEWTGPAGSQNPASITQLKAGSGGDASHEGAAAQPTATGPSVRNESATPTAGDSGPALPLAIAGLLAAAVSLVLSVVALRRAH